jgi:PAS domain S-box-containing protein
MVGVSLDITERKETEASLRQSEEFFRKVFQEGPLGLGLVSPDFRFLKVNRALCQMVGYSEEELVGLSFIDITHPDDVQADVQAAERLFKGEISSYKMRKRYLTKAGESLHISLTAALMRNREHEPVYGIAMIEDITETERNREAALARQKLESLGVLAGGIAHDFNNLLGGILAEAELVEADVSVGSASRAEIVRIKSAAVRGAEIVRELMIYAGQDQVSGMEPVDLSRLVEEMLELLKVSISKKIVLKTSLDEKLPIVWAQAPQIRQVVMNLVINAAEAIGSEQGVIKVSTSRSARTPGQDDVRNSASAEYVKMAVSDTGCGMTEELRAKIFDPFFTTKFAGRGLGLAVVLGIVRDHDGTVDVVSAPGQGATFEVFLPCTSKKPPTTPDGLTSFRGGQSSSRTATILVAEDEELLRLAVSKSLRKRGFSVLEANDGSAAIDLFRSHKDDIDLILLDVTLPGTSGREVFEEVLRLRPNMKIIVSSAYGKENVDATFRGLRIKHFIRKPFRLIELASMLEEVLSE